MVNIISDSPWEKQLRHNLLEDVDTVSDVKRSYDVGVRSADDAIGELVEWLKENGIYDDTAIIITSDHGESLIEHNIFFDHHGLYGPTIHVPLIIRAPGFNGSEDRFVQHLDIAPTILDLIGTDFDSNMFDGQSLRATGGRRMIERKAVYAQEAHTARCRSIRTKSHKYIKCINGDNICRYCGIEHGEAEKLYNIRKDPEEKINIRNNKSGIANNLDLNLRQWVSERPSPHNGSTAYETPEEVEKHLEDMGYI